MRQRILVLGADGFIGRRVVAALAATDWAVPIASGRRPSSRGQDDPVLRLQLDATDGAAVKRALDGVAGVVNCVAGSAETIERGAEVLFEAATALGSLSIVVHFSSMAVYGSAEGEIDESAPLRGDIGPYSQAKIAAERSASAYAHSVVLRPGIVYGPGSPLWSDSIGRLLLARRLGDLGHDGAGYCNLVYVEDVAAAVIRALRDPAVLGQVFNLAAPGPPTWNDYFHRYAAALGAGPVRTMGPLSLQWELRVVGPAIKLAEFAARAAAVRSIVLPPPIRPWLLQQCRHRIRLQSRRAQEILAMQWTPLSSGLRITADWLLSGTRILPVVRSSG